MVYKIFFKKSRTTYTGIEDSSKNQHLAEELHKPIIIKFKKCEVYLSFKDNVLGADLADMQLISK